jgi:hypothetical protein
MGGSGSVVEALDEESCSSVIVAGFGDLVGVVFDPLVVEAAGGNELVDVGGGAELPAAAHVMDLAQVGGDLTAGHRTGGIQGFQDLPLSGSDAANLPPQVEGVSALAQQQEVDASRERHPPRLGR